MPRRDGKGPEGKGPRTGKGLGLCVTKGIRNVATRIRRGVGRRLGRRR
ncbi:MAG: DUF5320 domain-containing protein [Chloroflexi bacterium]|nr:DUF5320 domain-containing protein [Chloroflexota bacterium]